MPNDDITKLEETIAHQDKQIMDLSDMVIALRDEIDVLKKQMLKMSGKISMVEDNLQDFSGQGQSVTDFAKQNKPPHY